MVSANRIVRHKRHLSSSGLSLASEQLPAKVSQVCGERAARTGRRAEWLRAPAQGLRGGRAQRRHQLRRLGGHLRIVHVAWPQLRRGRGLQRLASLAADILLRLLNGT